MTKERSPNGVGASLCSRSATKRQIGRLFGVVALALVTAGTSFPASALGQGSATWTSAIEVPGSASLNVGGTAGVNSISCASAGNCSAGGVYFDGSHLKQAFVVNETNGTWGGAIEVPGSASLNAGGFGGVYTISCASAGNCSAGGYYTDASGFTQALVVNETNGTWTSAIEVPGSASLNVGGTAGVNSISCASAGNCSAGGVYFDGSHLKQAFVVNETNGTWTSAIEVPGSASLNAGGFGGVYTISCASAGNCSAGGYYTDASGFTQAMVDDLTSVLITPTAPIISNLPSSGAVGSDFTAVIATDGDGTTTITTNSPSVCTVSGLVVTYVGVGTCSLTAHVGVGSDYSSADGTAQVITVSNAPQAGLRLISISGTYRSVLKLHSIGGSGTGKVTYAIASVGTAGCSLVKGTSLKATRPGTCRVTVAKAGDANYLAGHSTATKVTFRRSRL